MKPDGDVFSGHFRGMTDMPNSPKIVHLSKVLGSTAVLALTASSLLLAAGYGVAHGASAPTTGPYKDATISMDWNTDEIRTAVTGKAIPLVGPGSLKETALPQLDSVTLAFATGECGQETWGGVPGSSLGKANVSKFSAAGVDYTISTGGQAGVFRCASNAGMDKFLANYNSAQLAGIDYDIEGGQTTTDITNLIKTAEHAQAKNPK
ncbi:hypothetical protein, partial [Mycobacterium sp.]|uniref:hypothetical protein n=1 Tax=Mycobacterium sp. TaxID=1785 RepID=UPI003BACF867